MTIDSRLVSLTVSGWRQFSNVTIEFHERLTIVTGANGSGKSTLLNLIAPHFGWQVPFATAPPPLSSRVAEFATSVWKVVTRLANPQIGDVVDEPMVAVGEVRYLEGSNDIMVPASTTHHTYMARYAREHPLRGLFIPSHRPVFAPRDTRHRRGRVELSKAFESYSSAVQASWVPGVASKLTPLEVLKGTLLSCFSSSDDSRTAPWEFSNKLAETLPSAVKFRSLSTTDDEIVLETDTGNFTLDSVSGGLAALIDLTWQIYLYDRISPDGFIVVIDEPENHLHPELQRSVLPNLISAYPNVQFIVASHAPLVVTSVREANVYALVYKEAEVESGFRRVVESKRLQDFDRAGTANETLRAVLGLDITMPQWAASIIDDVVADVARDGYSEDAFKTLETRLKDTGLESYGAEVVEAVADRRRNDTAISTRHREYPELA